jgi:hypothetical protein
MQPLKGKVALVAGATRGGAVQAWCGGGAITPGFMRTEAILDSFGVTEANWRHAAENHPKAKSYGFISSETPCFVGRAIAALAAAPRVLEKSGGLYSSWGLARAYGFTDLDGSQPDWGRHFDFDELFKSQTGFRWTISRPALPQQERTR